MLNLCYVYPYLFMHIRICSIEEKLKDSLYAGEELKEKVIDLKNHIHLEKETVCK